jgi:hypothetical protein
MALSGRTSFTDDEARQAGSDIGSTGRPSHPTSSSSGWA